MLRAGDSIPHLALLDVLEPGSDIAHFPRAQPRNGLGLGRKHAHLHGLGSRPSGHEAQSLPLPHRAVHHPHIGYHPFIRVIVGIKYKCPQGGLRMPRGRRHLVRHGLQDLPHPPSLLGRDPDDVLSGKNQYLLHLFSHSLRLGIGQVHLVNHRYQGQPQLLSDKHIGHGLGLHALGGIHHHHRAFTGGQAPGHLVSEVHMAGGIDEV